MDFLIRDLPEELHTRIKTRAKERGCTMGAEILSLLEFAVKPTELNELRRRTEDAEVAATNLKYTIEQVKRLVQ